jgi:alpha-tubulin suppressor-like RCC1 family protein
MLRAKLQETTRLDLSQFTREELGHQCLMNKMKGKIFPGGIRSLVLDSRGRVERFELVRNEGYSLELLKTSKVGQVVAISDSEQTLLLNSQGQVFAFGDNASGQAGLGEQEYIEVPTLIKKPDLGKIIAVSAGGMHSLFLNSQGQVFSCGYGDHGELGLGDFDFRNIPTLIEDTGFGKITAISAGYDYSLILNSQGQVYAFGRNNLGQLGLGDDEAREVPTLVETPGFENIVAIAAGQSYSLALDSQGQVFTFGHEDFAFLPPEAYETLFIPKLVESQIMGKIVAISIGSGYSLLLNSRGQVYSLNVISVSREAHGGRYTVTLVNSPWNQHIVATSVAYDHSLFLNSQGQIFLIKDEEPGYIDFENLSEEKSLVLVKEITL